MKREHWGAPTVVIYYLLYTSTLSHGLGFLTSNVTVPTGDAIFDKLVKW